MKEIKVDCEKCEGTGTTSGRRLLECLTHLILIGGEHGKKGDSHPWLDDLPFSAKPTPDLAELTQGLADRGPDIWGHDAIDRHVATEKIISAAGLDPEKWGICPKCNGAGKY